jgi:hypothetical protein
VAFDRRSNLLICPGISLGEPNAPIRSGNAQAAIKEPTRVSWFGRRYRSLDKPFC